MGEHLNPKQNQAKPRNIFFVFQPDSQSRDWFQQSCRSTFRLWRAAKSGTRKSGSPFGVWIAPFAESKINRFKNGCQGHLPDLRQSGWFRQRSGSCLLQPQIFGSRKRTECRGWHSFSVHPPSLPENKSNHHQGSVDWIHVVGLPFCWSECLSAEDCHWIQRTVEHPGNPRCPPPLMLELDLAPSLPELKLAFQTVERWIPVRQS